MNFHLILRGTHHGNELHDRVVPIILEVEAELRDAVGASTRADMMALSTGFAIVCSDPRQIQPCAW